MTFSYEDESPKITFRIDPDLKERLEEHTDNKSRFIRAAIAEKLPDEDDDLDIERPRDPELALAYNTMRQLANDNGWVPQRIATNRLAQKLSMDKPAVRRHVLRQLARQGYLRMQTNSTGQQTAYQINHL